METKIKLLSDLALCVTGASAPESSHHSVWQPGIHPRTAIVTESYLHTAQFPSICSPPHERAGPLVAGQARSLRVAMGSTPWYS